MSNGIEVTSVETGKRTTVPNVLFQEVTHAKACYVWNNGLNTWFKVSKSEIRLTIGRHWNKSLMVTYRVDEMGVWIY